MRVRVRVRVCACVGVRVCACVRVCVCLPHACLRVHGQRDRAQPRVRAPLPRRAPPRLPPPVRQPDGQLLQQKLRRQLQLPVYGARAKVELRGGVVIGRKGWGREAGQFARARVRAARRVRNHRPDRPALWPGRAAPMTRCSGTRSSHHVLEADPRLLLQRVRKDVVHYLARHRVGEPRAVRLGRRRGRRAHGRARHGARRGRHAGGGGSGAGAAASAPAAPASAPASAAECVSAAASARTADAIHRDKAYPLTPAADAVSTGGTSSRDLVSGAFLQSSKFRYWRRWMRTCRGCAREAALKALVAG
jgi:hypothetical protein